ncbi:MAG: Dam family site-specific DNA-(adenine-N6)-methyltransferase [Bacilli bacterium]|nr:Dam family site-specific DNA-(adenine-N6)-methyltransferase [Bacilli bacterium]
MAISPLNYPGNKAKSLKELLDIIPKDIDVFVDAFAGSGMVSFNSSAKEIICNDINNHAIELIKYLYENSGESIIESMNKIIEEYGFTDSTNLDNHYIEYKHEGLSKYNKAPFDRLKSDYNSDKDTKKLFALIIYGFNHYLRFNKKGLFNVPVGKVDFSKSLREKTIAFCNESKKYKALFSTKDYLDRSLYDCCTKNSFVYFDPPYLVTTAPYNGEWSQIDDLNLFTLFDKLSQAGIKAALSNVFISNGKKNEELIKWAEKYHIHYLKRQYRNANYQKVNITDSIEVLITNF